MPTASEQIARVHRLQEGKRTVISRVSAISSLVVGLALANASDAHVGLRVFPIYELPTADLPDLHDGSLEDWVEVLPDAALNHFDFQASTSSWEGPDPGDLAWRVFLAWHDASQRLLVAVERLDDVLVEGDWYEFFSFMVDGDHSGGQYVWYSEPGRELTDAEIRRNYAQAQWYDSGMSPREGRVLYGGGTASSWAYDPPWTEAGNATLSVSPHHYVVEFAVTPWDELSGDGPAASERSVLEADGVVGFQMLVSDSDEPNRPKGQYVIAPALMNELSQSADNFVDGWLVPCDTRDCSRGPSTVVVGDSWGRIKAGLAARSKEEGHAR